MDKEKKTIAQRLIKCRIMNNLTQVQMCKEIGCSKTMYIQYEQGIAQPTKYLERVEQVLKKKWD